MTDVAAREVLVAACEEAGLDAQDAQLMRAHSNAVWLLPSSHAVVRIGRKQHRGLRFEAGLALTRWLAERDIPVTEPLMDHAIEINDATVTVWRYYPQSADRGEPPMRDLGAILRRLHALPRPPLELHPYPPLSGLTTILGSEAAHRVLDPDDRAWLDDRAAELLDRYERLESVLGVDFIHGDPYPGNCLWDGDERVVLGDWDEASIGPRELDLIPSCHDHLRFGAPEDDLVQFFRAYGLALEEFRTWPAFDVLISMRDLHTLTGYIRRAAADDHAAARELHRRLGMLRDPNTSAKPWHGM
ncbi:phosphotransferase [Nocardia nova]|uniref:Phosphotransferase n=1 Tax=Nocardia nova TaxID=37330 RepID=A0A2S6AMG7_9NOCA|nr:aminoglycoside phosphotransferase family protein [Nocardia nova]PPJ36418.1 phosphotransferase [Nocardia nova]